MKAREQALQASSALRRKKGKKQWSLLWLTLPFMILILLFNYVPLGGWILSIFDYRAGKSLFDCEFVGLKYFKMIFTDRNIPSVLKNTVIFSAIWFCISWLPMMFAVLLNEIQCSKFRKFTQTMTTLPNFISWVIIYSLAFSIFSSEGALNMLIYKLGGPQFATNILADSDSVYVVQTAIAQWKGLGWASIIYIAAISGIDQEQYEAAMIDGAGRLRCAIHITFPSILPTFVVLMLLDISNILNTGYEQYFLFKNAITAPKIEVLDLYVYRMGLQLADYSYATAVGIVKSLISITMLFGANALAKKIRGTSIV
ncbi:MAG: ABC transporter permease subunit [Firmicutes bacterium]|nr:ABC transporter permease subunit [Bacillota bacterium]